MPTWKRQTVRRVAPPDPKSRRQRPIDAPFHATFDVVKGTQAQALKIANRLNVWPIVMH